MLAQSNWPSRDWPSVLERWCGLTDLILFHHDPDYGRIASVLPELEERHFLQ